MIFNTQNSFLISAFMHLIFFAFFIAAPKPDCRVKQMLDMSFLFSESDSEIQDSKKAKDISTLKSEIEPKKISGKMETKEIQNDSDRKALDKKISSEPLQNETVRAKEVYQTVDNLNIETSMDHQSPKTESSLRRYDYMPSASGAAVGVKSGSNTTLTATAASKDVASFAHTDAGIDKSALIRSFMDRIESAKQYPYIARRKRIEGVVLILVHLDKTGSLKGIALKSSSGHEILDRNTIELIKKVTPFRHGYPSDLKIEIPVSYRLVR